MRVGNVAYSQCGPTYYQRVGAGYQAVILRYDSRVCAPRRQRFRLAVLVVVATMQVVMAKTAGLTPWKGGGFGMFSTLDHGAVSAASTSWSRRRIDPKRIEIPQSLEELAARAASCPSDWLLRRLAAAVVARERRYERPVTPVRLTVWRTQFDPVTLAASERTLRTFVYQVP